MSIVAAAALVVSLAAVACVESALHGQGPGAVQTNATSSSRRQPRLFSNPFGILGHADCSTQLPNRGDRPLFGQCYNEAILVHFTFTCICLKICAPRQVECIVKRGRFSEYCGPPAVTGVCCVFATERCDATVVEKVAYFTNPSYPYEDSKPTACMLKIKPQTGTCWVGYLTLRGKNSMHKFLSTGIYVQYTGSLRPGGLPLIFERQQRLRDGLHDHRQQQGRVRRENMRPKDQLRVRTNESNEKTFPLVNLLNDVLKMF